MAQHAANTTCYNQEYYHANASQGRRSRARNTRSRATPNVGCSSNFGIQKLTTVGQKLMTKWADISITEDENSSIVFHMDMLSERVASCDSCSFQKSIGSPMALLSQPEKSTAVINALDTGDQTERHIVLLWLVGAVRQLALSKAGCRIVQKAFEVAAGSDQDMLIAGLQDHIVELYESPNGNYVLARAIEVLPAAKVGFVTSAFRGRCATVAKHRFGCRIVLRLIEHCVEEQISDLLDEIMIEAPTLAQHAYGNLILQCMFEHMPPARRSSLVTEILPCFATMSTHRTGSLVAQRVLTYCNIEEQQLAIWALLQSSVVDIACSHYGSYVIEQVASMRASHPCVQMMANILASNRQLLAASEHAERVVQAFEF